MADLRGPAKEVTTLRIKDGIGPVRPREREARGYTLVELAITLSIIMIVTALGVASIRGVFPRLRLNATARTLAAEISLLRTRAIARNMSFRMVIDPAAETYALLVKDGGGYTGFSTAKTAAGIDIEKVENATGGVLWIRSNGTMGTIDGSGGWQDLVYGTPAVIVLQTCEAGDQDGDGTCDAPGAFARRIAVEVNGRVRIEP